MNVTQYFKLALKSLRTSKMRAFLTMLGIIIGVAAVIIIISLGNGLTRMVEQRVSIARALAGKPSVILADEPTGALDSRTGREVLRFLQKLNQEGDTVVLITHDNSIAVKAKRIVRLQDGRIIYDGDASDPQAVVQPQEDAGEGEPA